MDKPSGADTLMMSIGAITIGAPFAFVGIILCFTVWGILPGIVLIIFSGVPLYMVQKRSIEKKVNYEMRDHPMNDEEPPWNLDTDS